MMEITDELIARLFEEAALNPRLRVNVDLRNSASDASQRMLNALLPGTKVDIHRHPMSSESVVCLSGCLDEVLYDGTGKETGRIRLCPAEGKYGCQIQPGVWHTVDVNGNDKCTDFGNRECSDFGNSNAPISVTTIHNFR